MEFIDKVTVNSGQEATEFTINRTGVNYYFNGTLQP